LIERDYSGPARVAGSVGTGKTIVALHRAVHLARANQETRVLLTTFSETLANALRAKLRALIHNEPRLGERVEVHSLDAIARRLDDLNFGDTQKGRARIVDRDAITALLKDAAKSVESNKFSLYFLRSEWEQVVDAWQLESWESYRDVARLGRRTRLPENQRALLWQIFAHVPSALARKGLVTMSGILSRLAVKFASGAHGPFDFIVVDEPQDIGVSQLRFLASLANHRRNAIFFAGGLGQRIFQPPFSWKLSASTSAAGPPH
jgi:superfamily I DNA/RNA helicase